MRDLYGIRIAFIAGTLGQGGAERQLYYILRALASNHANVRVLTLTQGEFWESQIRDLGVHLVFVGAHPARPARLSAVLRELRSFRPQICQSQHFYTNLYAVVASRLLGIREIGAIRGDVTHEVGGTGRLGKWSLMWPRLLAANSNAAIETAVRAGVERRRLRLLPNVVDTEHFSPGPRHSGPLVRIAAVGRLGPEKNYPRLLNALTRVRLAARTPFRVSIYGSGALRDDLGRLARELSLGADVVEFAGTSSRMVDVYRQADILVCTSDHEGTPNVIMEAMSCGVPVVSTAVGGVMDLVADGSTGFTVPVTDEPALADRLTELIDGAGLREMMGRQAREVAVRQMAVERLPEYLTGLYDYALT